MPGLTAGGTNTPDDVGEPDAFFEPEADAEVEPLAVPIAVPDASCCSPADPVGVVAGGVFGGLIGLLDLSTSELASDTSGAEGHWSERISSPDNVCIRRTPSAAPLTTSPNKRRTSQRSSLILYYCILYMHSFI